jgi:DNA-binding SARP family transcriptional activator
VVAGVPILNLRLLGSFRADAVGAPRGLTFSCKKSRALLAYLAMRANQPVDREELSDLLWDVRRGRDPRHNLRQCLVDMRNQLEPFPGLLITNRDVVSLDGRLCNVDARTFVQSIEAGQFEYAAALYNGEFLKGLTIDTEGFAAWAAAERLRISGMAGHLFEQIMKTAFLSGDGSKVLAAAEKLVALDPLHETRQRMLMQAYAKFRGRHAAILHGRKFVESLKRDLDVMPEPETIALLDIIRKGDNKALMQVDGSLLAV